MNDLDDEDNDSYTDEEWWEERGYELVQLPTQNLVGSIASVAEQTTMPWTWQVAQRHMRQRSSLTGWYRRGT